MHNDVAALDAALRRRGVLPEEILCLEGSLNRRLLLSFFQSIHERIAGWQAGSLFLYISSHGFFTGETAEEARVGIQLPATVQPYNESQLFWDEIFQTLAPPAGVTLTLLPDH